MAETPTMAVIGLGRFGRFWAGHLQRHLPLCLYDADPSRKNLPGVAVNWRPLPECLSCRYVFLTIPIGAIPEFLGEHAGRLAPGTVLIDCASVKSTVMKWMAERLPASIYFLSTHPLFGPDSAAAGIRDQRIAVIPGRLPYANFQFLIDLFRGQMGLRVLSMSPAEHDRLMAYNLALVHHIGRAVAALQPERLRVRMAGLQKLEQVARVATNDSAELFRDFYRYNPYAAELRMQFLKEFEQLPEKLI